MLGPAVLDRPRFCRWFNNWRFALHAPPAPRPLPVTVRQVDKLFIEGFASRSEMAAAAARDVVAALVDRLARQERVRMVFGAAPSQAEMLSALRAAPGIDWGRVVAFHMDEYIGLPEGAPQRFGQWLQAHIFGLPFAAAHKIVPGADAEAEARRYEVLLNQAPIDFVCLGIGVNGHIAFNDPPAYFEDRRDVKVVDLDQVCRQQQVNDQCFVQLSDVPKQAVTLTIPRLLRADRLFCVVPTRAKRDAVRAALHGPITPDCPGSILRTHPNCTLYLDADSDPDA